MSESEKSFWSTVSKAEKPGVVILIALGAGALVFNLGVAVGKYLF